MRLLKKKRGLCIVLSVFLVGLSIMLSSEVCSAQEKKSPLNILFILADDVGQEALGCYGGTSYQTPQLDQLAASGMRFENCFSMPVCHPSRIALMTGRYPFRFKSKWGDFPNEVAESSLGHLLKANHYATAVAGKWQLTLFRKNPDHAKELGFDESCLFGWHEGPRYWQPMIYQNGKVRDDVKDAYGPDVYADFLIDFMKRNQHKPFFAYFPMALCHDVTDDIGKPVPFGPGKKRYESFGEMVHEMDRIIGKLMKSLDELKLRENTLVIYTTDNGSPFSTYAFVKNDKLIKEKVVSVWNGQSIPGGKGTLPNTGTNIPLIVSCPTRVKAGSVNPGLVDFSDFLPTFIDVVDAELPKDIAYDGVSFKSLFFENQTKNRSWAFAEHRGKAFVRTEEYKLYTTGKYYNVKEDPLEKKVLDRNLIPKETQHLLENVLLQLKYR